MKARRSSPWRRVPIVDLCTAHVDCVNRTAPAVREPTPFKMIRTTNVKDGFIDTDNVRFVTEATYRKWTRRLVPRRGDVILTREAPLGDVGKVRNDDLLFLGQRLYHFRNDPHKLDADFLLYSLLGPDLQAQIRSFGSGSTVEHMRLSDIPQLEILAPDVSEQRSIAGILAAHDDLIDNARRRIAILEEMTRALFREWFVQFRFPGYRELPTTRSHLGAIPQGWMPRQLGDIITLHYGKALKLELREEGNVPVFGSSGVVGTHNTPLVKGPGIIVGRKGNVGSIFWSDESFYPIDTVYFVSSQFPLRFVYHELQRKNFLNSDAAVPGLNRNQAYSLPTVVPTADIMDLFCRHANALEGEASLLRRQVQNLCRTRDLLLPRLLSGELRVPTSANTL